MDEATSTFINENFVPLAADIKKHPAYFHQFDALWTPTVLILDANGIERRYARISAIVSSLNVASRDCNSAMSR